jgi:TPR repeat protein
MEMMQSPPISRLPFSPSHYAQQADDMLNVLLKQTDKSALNLKLNTGCFSQQTLHSLLYKAFLEQGPDVVALMLTTKSYSKEVLAKIIVTTLTNELEKNEQRGEEQQRFIDELLRDPFLKVEILNTAFHIAAKKGMKLNDGRPLIDQLIKLSARVLTSEEAAQIAHACSDIAVFLFFVQLDHDNSASVIAPVISPGTSPNTEPVILSGLSLQQGEQAYRAGMTLFQAIQPQQALPYFEQSAASGYPAACLYLYVIYRGEKGVPIDEAKRDSWGKKVTQHVPWFNKQAETGQAEAQFNLGRCYYYGLGVPKDLHLAVKYCKLAAEQGYAIAQITLGGCYQNGEGVIKDLTLAVKYYQLAADQGNATAQTNLGSCYKNGWGVPKDLTLAVKYYQLAADQGYALAQNNLGNCYKNGWDVPKDLNLAVKYYQLAADQGLAEAQNNLGNCYKKGWGVPKDLTLAAMYYQLAAGQGSALAQNSLGNCYKNGWGVLKDPTLAVKYYRLASDQGLEDAQFNLSFCYKNERDASKDVTVTVKYPELAVNQGQ